MIKQAFILCAGKGTRMHPDTLDKPKCLLDISNKPVLGRIADWLNNHNVNKVIINLHWKPDLVIEYLESLPKIQPIFSIEKQLLGTASGIAAVSSLLDDVFVVVYGDVLTNMNLFRLYGYHKAHNADLTMASVQVDNPQECGVIIPPETGPVEQLIEKPQDLISDVVNAGIMICNKEVFSEVKEKWDIAKNLIPFLISKGKKVYHLSILENEWLIDMGTRTNYVRCCDKYKDRQGDQG